MDMIMEAKLGPYAGQPVKITQTNGQITVGNCPMDGIAFQNRTLSVGGSTFSFDDIADIEYVGKITDYHNRTGTGTINDRIHFSCEDCKPSLHAWILKYHHEYECSVSCHVEWDHENARFFAKDIDLLEVKHVLAARTLREEEWLYLFHDRSALFGTLQLDGQGPRLLLANGQQRPLEEKAIREITKKPAMGDILTVVSNGQEIEGPVSAVGMDSFVLLLGGSPKNILLSEVDALYYQGAVKYSGNVGYTIGGFPSKVHYLVNPQEEEFLLQGAKVLFAVGVDAIQAYAKEIRILEKISRPEAAKKTQLGILGYLNFGIDDGAGFVMQRYAVGEREASNIRFFRNQMAGFSKKPLTKYVYGQTIYIVRYTLQPVMDHKYWNVDFMELVEALPKQDYCSVEIDPDTQQIVKKSISTQVLKEVVGYEIDVLCEEDVLYAGRLISCENGMIELSRGDGGASALKRLDEHSIKDVHVYGYVTAFNMINGTGRINQRFFFHVNDMENKTVLPRINQGAFVRYKLRCSNKGDGWSGIILDAWPDRQEGYVVDCYKNQYVVLSAEAYTGGLRQRQPYYVYEINDDTFADIGKNDYRVSYKVSRELGQYVLSELRVTGICEGKRYDEKELAAHLEYARYGFVIAFDGRHGTVVRAEDYGLQKGGDSFEADAGDTLPPLAGTDRLDYRVEYCLYQQDGVYKAKILRVLDANGCPKMRFGVLIHYDQARHYGFIRSEDQPAADARGRVYFQINQPGEISAAAAWDTRNNTYDVSYIEIPGTNGGSRGDQARGDRVRCLRANPRFVRPVSAPPAAIPAKPALVQRPEVISSTPLADLARSAGFDPVKQAQAEYGFICVYYPNSVGFIYGAYCNKQYAPNGEPARSEARMFSTAEATIQGVDKINTSKMVYVVRYVPGGTLTNPRTGQELPSINADHPIEVIAKFDRRSVARLSFEEDRLVAHGMALFGNGLDEANEAEEDMQTAQCPELMRGETVFLAMQDESIRFVTFQSRTDTTLSLQNGQQIRADDVKTIWRLGVINGYSPERRTPVGYLNGNLEFSLHLTEIKTYNILMTNNPQNAKLHVMYFSKDCSVVSVQRIPKEYLERIPWENGIITSCDRANRKITIDNQYTHHLTVLSDSYVNRLCNLNEAIGKPVFAKKVTHFYQQGEASDPRMLSDAVMVHCQQERAYIRFDEVRGQYLAYRDETTYYVIEGSKAYLEDVAARQQEITVTFRVSADRYSLIAYSMDDINRNELDEDDPAEEGGNALINSVLCKHRLECLDLKLLQLPASIALQEDGMPQPNQAQLALNVFAGRQSSADDLFAAALLKKHYRGINHQSLPRGLHRILRKAFERHAAAVARDPNGCLGEYSYYLATLINETSGRIEWYLYALFIQDFCDRNSVVNAISIQASRGELERLFQQECHNVRGLIAHIAMLPEAGYDVVKGCVAGNRALQASVTEEAARILEKKYDAFEGVLPDLRKAYRDGRGRFSQSLKNETGCEQISECLHNMEKLLAKLFCEDDRLRLAELRNVCEKYRRAKDGSDFEQKNRDLIDAYRMVRDMEAEAQNHPTREAIELLVMNNVFSKIKDRIHEALNGLYQDPEMTPRIQCIPNEVDVARDVNKLILILQNGDEAHAHIQAAENLVLRVESYTRNVSVSAEASLSHTALHAGSANSATAEISVNLQDLEENKFSISVSAEFDCYDSFTKEPVRRTRKVEMGVLSFQIRDQGRCVQKQGVNNPYAEPAKGQPLATGEMFFGRKREFATIWTHIVRARRLRPRQVTIIYGQKKCGKTSLVNQVINGIKGEENLRSEAIILHIDNILEKSGGARALKYFNLCLYSYILRLFERIVRKDHPELYAHMRENNLKIPDLMRDKETSLSLFTSFFEDFADLDRGKHTIVLIMDEFTSLCAEILKGGQADPSLYSIPNFIQMLSGMGFVQIIIGHETMMRAFEQLGVLNHTAEFALKLEISALNPADARELVVNPMLRSFDFPVYETPLGKKGVEHLLELSGCSPYFLMKLCNKMFDHYISLGEGHPYILESDVENMKKAYLESEVTFNDFDVLLREDGDAIGLFEDLSTTKYLISVSKEIMKTPDRTFAYNWTCEEIGADESSTVRGILEARRVITAPRNGRIRINVGLFPEFVVHRYGRG